MIKLAKQESVHVPAAQRNDGASAPRIGILGGGQLAKMTAVAAAQLGCKVVVLERQDSFPAQSVATQAIIGDWNDPASALRLASLVDVVTLENEFVNIDVLSRLVDEGHTLLPAPETMALVQDKLHQKLTFAKAGLPVPRFADVPTMERLKEFALPSVLKKRRNGYDGKGNVTVRSAEEIPGAWKTLDGDRLALYVEEFCPFVMELAVIVTRGRDGTVASYPLVQTLNRDHICHVVKVPADVPLRVKEEANRIAVRAVESIGGVGSFGLEMFLLEDGGLLINEIAPRVHNTGHYTIEACHCSQFENHVRAILGWPLGSTETVTPAAAMVNLLARGEGPGTPQGLENALAVAGAHVHLYGKTRSSPGRKMGHVTALGQTIKEACAIAQRAADCIHFGES